MSMSTFLEEKVINHVLRNTAYTAPATVYIALFTADPGEAGSLASEVAGNAYARQSMTWAAPSGSPRETATGATITFPAATPGAWGTVSHWAVMDASTSGNVLYSFAFDVAKAVNANDVVEIASGQLKIRQN